jgi:hypothetical protein
MLICPFASRGPGECDSWKASVPSPGPDMVNILKRIVALQGEGGLKMPDLLVAFIDAHVLPFQRRSHKMYFLGSNRDPTRKSSKALSAREVAQKANKIAEVKLLTEWKWGLKPHYRDNQIAEVNSPDLALLLPSLGISTGWTTS